MRAKTTEELLIELGGFLGAVFLLGCAVALFMLPIVMVLKLFIR